MKYFWNSLCILDQLSKVKRLYSCVRLSNLLKSFSVSTNYCTCLLHQKEREVKSYSPISRIKTPVHFKLFFKLPGFYPYG